MEHGALYWEDVTEEAEIPAVSMAITRHRIVMIVAATRDIFPLHHDEEFARSSGYTAPAVATAFLQGLIGRCLTDWTGPAGVIRRLGLTLRAPTLQGDTINVGGIVVRKYRDGGENRVDCHLAVVRQDGTTSVTAEATVAIPSRSEGALRPGRLAPAGKEMGGNG